MRKGCPSTGHAEREREDTLYKEGILCPGIVLLLHVMNFPINIITSLGTWTVQHRQERVFYSMTFMWFFLG